MTGRLLTQSRCWWSLCRLPARAGCLYLGGDDVVRRAVDRVDDDADAIGELEQLAGAGQVGQTQGPSLHPIDLQTNEDGHAGHCSQHKAGSEE